MEYLIILPSKEPVQQYLTHSTKMLFIHINLKVPVLFKTKEIVLELETIRSHLKQLYQPILKILWLENIIKKNYVGLRTMKMKTI
jgi:hypothetical protein